MNMNICHENYYERAVLRDAIEYLEECPDTFDLSWNWNPDGSYDYDELRFLLLTSDQLFHKCTGGIYRSGYHDRGTEEECCARLADAGFEKVREAVQYSEEIQEKKAYGFSSIGCQSVFDLDELMRVAAFPKVITDLVGELKRQHGEFPEVSRFSATLKKLKPEKLTVSVSEKVGLLVSLREEVWDAGRKKFGSHRPCEDDLLEAAQDAGLDRHSRCVKSGWSPLSEVDVLLKAAEDAPLQKVLRSAENAELVMRQYLLPEAVEQVRDNWFC